MKNDELREQQLGILMDLNNGKLCVNEANTKIRELYTEPKEQDICPECGGKGFYYIGGIEPVTGMDERSDCEACNGTGKAHVDKIREAFENIDYDFIGTLPEQFAFQWFSKGYKSQQAEIDSLQKLKGYNSDLLNQNSELMAEIERLKGCIKTALIIDAKDGYSMHPKACEELVNAIKEDR